jgi:hypothetical protein
MREVCVRGSACGTMIMDLTSTQRPSEGISILALLPAWIAATCACGTVATTRSVEGSKPVMSGRPGEAISPSSTWRADTTPLYGATTVAKLLSVAAAPAPATSALTRACAAL